MHFTAHNPASACKLVALVQKGSASCALDKQTIKRGSIPVNILVAGKPSFDGKFSLAQWNREASSSSSNVMSRAALNVVLVDDNTVCMGFTPKLESRRRNVKGNCGGKELVSNCWLD